MSDLERQILKDIEAEFDRSVNASLAYWVELKYWETQGWTHVMLPKFQDDYHAVDITHWLENNGYVDRVTYYRDGREFVFREPEMATAFVLRWA